jgi:membrane-associated phospholipid phosphatase
MSFGAPTSQSSRQPSLTEGPQYVRLWRRSRFVAGLVAPTRLDNGRAVSRVANRGHSVRSRRSLLAMLLVATISTLAFVSLLLNVLQLGALTQIDPVVTAFVVQHRAGWLTSLMSLVTWLGSSVIITPFWLLVGGSFLYWRRTWQPFILLGSAFLGAAALYEIIKPSVGRFRPAGTLQVGGPNTEWAFPSGHATQSVAFYGMLAAIIITWLNPRRPLLVAGLAALIAISVGASRIYLGVHWLTDVLGGFALGSAWLAIVMLCWRFAVRRSRSR